MRKILFLTLLTLSFSQETYGLPETTSFFGGNLSLMGAFPQGEFKDQEVPSTLGLDLNLLYYINNHAAIGVNLGVSEYGFSQREIPLNQWTNIGLIEETRNSMDYSNLLLKIIPIKGPIKIYGEGLIGLKNLSTTTKLFSKSNNCDDEETSVDECEIAEQKDASDTAFGYGLGGGIEVVLSNRKGVEESSMGTLSLLVSAKYLWGGEVQYLKEGGITVTPNPDPTLFPIIDYDWNESRTDVMHYNIGLHFTSK